MPVSSFPKNAKDGTLTISDNTSGTPLSLTVPLVLDDLTLANFKQQSRELVTAQSRGEFYMMRLGNRETADGGFTVGFTHFTSSTSTSVLDAIMKTGYFASAVSFTAAIGDVMTYKVTLTKEGTSFGDAADHTCVLEKCYLFSNQYSELMSGDTVSVSFIRHHDVTFT